ncbi:hypothetical protein C0J52_15984 [Blattella germanica]|nr:hypothetical protein C0J52_15984 [Blattella germanica]
MACRYSIEERRKIAAWMEVFQSPRIVQERFRAWTGRDAPSRLTIGRIYEKFVRTGSVQDDCKGNSGRKRSVRTEENIINVQGAMVASPTKSTRRLARETKISRRSLIRILHYDLGMKPYHLQVVQQLTDADKQAQDEMLGKRKRQKQTLLKENERWGKEIERVTRNCRLRKDPFKGVAMLCGIQKKSKDHCT